MKNKNWSIGVLLFIATFSAQADSDYQCTIQKISTVEGTPNPTLQLYNNSFIGKQFSVERETGHMVGALKNSYATKPQVIDYGSKENSFKAVTIQRIEEGAGKGSNIYALTINEFSKSPKKPFVFLNNDVVFFGSCEHF